MICSAVSIQSTRVTDRQTELPWHIRAIAYAVARKIQANSYFNGVSESGLFEIMYFSSLC